MSEPRYDYDERIAAGREALGEGRLEDALAAFEQAAEVAGQLGEPSLADTAFCNCAAVRIELGDLTGPIAELRRILMANRSLDASFLASYHVARSYELQKRYRRGLFYAQIAHDRATTLERPSWLSAALNLVGNFEVAQSRFGDALETYRRALELLPGDDRLTRLTIETNVGYCLVTEGHLGAGLTQLYRAARAVRREGLERLVMITHLDLSFALLEAGRPDRAVRHADRGLELAEAMGDADWVKNGLYLAGEARMLAGDPDGGQERFGSLQSRFYPDQPFVVDFLTKVDVRQVVNLRA